MHAERLTLGARFRFAGLALLLLGLVLCVRSFLGLGTSYAAGASLMLSGTALEVVATIARRGRGGFRS